MSIHVFHKWSEWEDTLDTAGVALQVKRCSVCNKLKRYTP